MARGAVVDFDAFMAGCKMKYQQLAEMAADKGAEGEELLSAAQGCALLVLLGGGAPNSRPGQLYPLAVSSAGAPPCLAPRCDRRGCLGNTITLGGGAARLVFFHHKCFESWRLEPAVIELQVRAACGGRRGGARAPLSCARRAQAGTAAARVLDIAARAPLQTARGKTWAPLFTAAGGELMAYSTFRGRIVYILREELQLGAAVTATSLRRAMVDYFMSGDFSDEQRAGARSSRPARRARICAARWDRRRPRPCAAPLPAKRPHRPLPLRTRQPSQRARGTAWPRGARTTTSAAASAALRSPQRRSQPSRWAGRPRARRARRRIPGTRAPPARRRTAAAAGSRLGRRQEAAAAWPRRSRPLLTRASATGKSSR